jgi:hypothetical protein
LSRPIRVGAPSDTVEAAHRVFGLKARNELGSHNMPKVDIKNKTLSSCSWINASLALMRQASAPSQNGHCRATDLTGGAPLPMFPAAGDADSAAPATDASR